jgi:adenylate cyclase
MRRSVLPTFVIAFVVALVTGALHGFGILFAPETWIANLVARSEMTRSVASFWQYAVVFAVAFAVAWFTLENTRRNRVGWIVTAIVAELLALMWVCALYGISFQPLPSILAALLSYAGARTFARLLARERIGALAGLEGRLSEGQIAKARSGELPFNGSAASFETSVIVCDIANKYDLADSSEPASIAQISERFNRQASEALLKAGAYLHSADGEGVIGVFGFPDGASDHAEKAVQAAFELTRIFATALQSSNGETPVNVSAHVGVSSGAIIAAPMSESNDILVIGEPIELARRFSVANRFYGSRILMGPRTFEMASNAFVARPIDFLTGVSAQDRHEIYEPLAPAADAPNDLVARRDSFWNGVVLYREKRWAEAYNEFQKARAPGDEEDAPLNLYLRRLEPLALHLMESPGEDRF